MSMQPPGPQGRYVRCRYCGWVFRGLLPIDYKPDGAMLLHHLSAMHRDDVKPLLERMRTEDIGTVVKCPRISSTDLDV
jgi:hypothetical protein